MVFALAATAKYFHFSFQRGLYVIDCLLPIVNTGSPSNMSATPNGSPSSSSSSLLAVVAL